MSVAISDIRTVPIGEDLTSEDLTLQVLRGLETANRADVTLASSVTLNRGDWAVLNSDGNAAAPGSSASSVSYLVFAGSERFDVRATGKVTLLMGPPGMVVKSSQFDSGGTYAVGTYLTVKTGGTHVLTSVSGSDIKVAKVLEVGSGYLVFQLL